MDFARFVCAFREYPLRVYAHKLQGKMVFSTSIVLSNSILSFYTDYTRDGRYIAYDAKGGKETASVTDSIKTISNFAPIIHLESLPFPPKTSTRIKNKFKTAKVRDLGSLARLTYDPEWPDEPKVTLLSFSYKKKWVIGYVTIVELDESDYCFNYVELDAKPDKPFVKYSGHKGVQAKLTDKFEHGFPYLPIVKLKSSHKIFGLK
jgi:hypothetical protein